VRAENNNFFVEALDEVAESDFLQDFRNLFHAPALNIAVIPFLFFSPRGGCHGYVFRSVAFSNFAVIPFLFFSPRGVTRLRRLGA
jgi:hypothetical protein